MKDYDLDEDEMKQNNLNENHAFAVRRVSNDDENNK